MYALCIVNTIFNLTVLIGVLKNCSKDYIFNFVSSWFVYGEVENLPAREDDPCNPKGFYSITKRTAEQLLISYCETFGIKYRILRLCNVIGKNDSGVSKKKNALQFLIEKLKSNEDIDLYYDGYFIRDYMYVDDVCRAIHTCLQHGNLNEITNIGSGRDYMFRDIIMYCKKKLGSTSKINRVDPSRFHQIVQVKDMWLDNYKLEQLGFKIGENIFESMDRLLK